MYTVFWKPTPFRANIMTYFKNNIVRFPMLYDVWRANDVWVRTTNEHLWWCRNVSWHLCNYKHSETDSVSTLWCGHLNLTATFHDNLGKLVPECWTIMEVSVLTSGTPRRAKLQLNHHHHQHTNTQKSSLQVGCSCSAQPTMSLSLRHVTWSKSSRCHKDFKYYYSLAHGSTYVYQLRRAQSSNLLVLANIWAPFDTSVVVSVASVTAFSHFNYIKSILYGCPIMQFTCLQQAQRMHLPQIQHSSHAVTFLSTARTSICSQ